MISMKFKHVVEIILVAIFMGIGVGVCTGALAEEAPSNSQSSFDVSALEAWCGEPCGQVRMVGASYYAEDAVIDETGNVWNYDGELNEDDYYLMWLDDMGTNEVEDDEIVKLWAEVH